MNTLMHHAWMGYAIPLGLLVTGMLWDHAARLRRQHTYRRAQRAARTAHAITVGARTRDALDQAEHIINTEAARLMPGLDMEDGWRWPW